MEEYIKYIVEKDSETIFNEKFEERIIEVVLGDTEAYQNLKAEGTDEETLPVEWINREDIYLANFSFNMFVRSKKIMASDLNLEYFKTLWDNYILTSDYYIQVANYMNNSDDYLSGERYQLKESNQTPSAKHKSNLIQNMKSLQASFQGHPEKDSLYVQKVGQMGIELLEIIQN